MTRPFEQLSLFPFFLFGSGSSWLGGGNENVLGGNVLFKIKNNLKEVEIPIIEANDENLLYYGAILVDENMIISFPNKEYPIWKTELGKNYIDGYILTDAGKGFYLEWHTDRIGINH